MNLHPYLIFPGTCRAAMNFYAECLGGTLVHLQTVGDSHLEVAPEPADRIFHSILVAGDIRIGASDGQVGQDPVMGQNFSLFVMIPDEGAQARLYEALMEGGTAIMPLSEGFAMLEDRFGIRWMLARE